MERDQGVLKKNLKLVATLAKNDFKARFAGSYLGKIWAFIQPIVTITVYWFVFEIGLRSGSMVNYPFVVWLVAGLVPWFYFSEAWSGGTNSMLEYSYLVKKVVFNIDLLPVVKVISALFINAFFVLVAIILCWAYGYHPTPYTLQLVYYHLAMVIMVSGLCYMTSAVVVFFRDLSQIIAILLQVGMWATPILWPAAVTLKDHPTLIKIFQLNPMYYIVEGYRDSLFARVGIWERPLWALYFWCFTALTFFLGTRIFKRLKVHFADVL